MPQTDSALYSEATQETFARVAAFEATLQEKIEIMAVVGTGAEADLQKVGREIGGHIFRLMTSADSQVTQDDVEALRAEVFSNDTRDDAYIYAGELIEALSSYHPPQIRENLVDAAGSAWAKSRIIATGMYATRDALATYNAFVGGPKHSFFKRYGIHYDGRKNLPANLVRQ